MPLDPLILNTNKHLPTHLTAIFVGGTSGIGLYTLLALATHCPNPTIYIIGRSHSAGTRILSDLKALNAAGTYIFIPSDVSLIKNVDSVCKQILEKEQYVNLVFLSTGVMSSGTETAEGLHEPASLILHSRTRFILNLLPLLRAAPLGSPKRVVSVLAGTKEGSMDATDDLQCRHVKVTQMIAMRSFAASMVTLSLESCAKRAPDVGFVHWFPGPVRSGFARGDGLLKRLIRGIIVLLGWLVFIPEKVCGERGLWVGTVDGFGGRGKGGEKGSDGEVGSGVYCVNEKGDVGGEAVVGVLKKLRKEGKGEIVWKHVVGEFLRITGVESLHQKEEEEVEK
ncbi:hypothetical protein B0J11DRAFT_71979 [Dendryphion nanum]|uniref:Ketoreductase (KR) domain-containing protein n=1 Tax=Dendryphion nanum TaxID=256645 RepID=A0A9P9IHW1_9PLEO|nr:hypothetical protein B0J11DRAFT_71979 [Dendryphion nanum]